jgi:hypothetical protein
MHPNSSPIHRRALECLSAGAVVFVPPKPRSPALAALGRGYAMFSELRRHRVQSSLKFGLLLTVAVVLADGALKLVIRSGLRVSESRGSFYSLLIYS